MNSRTLASGLLLLALIGCRRAAPPAYTPSEAVAAFATYGEDDDQRRMWSLLQEKIGQALRQRCGAPLQPVMLGEEEFDRRHLARGAAVYQRRCVQCHGVNGDGRGPAAPYLKPRPRDYRQGIFKFTSTPGGARPRRADIVLTLRRGVTGASMPAFDELPKEDLEAVADYVIALSRRGQLELQLAMVVDQEEDGVLAEVESQPGGDDQPGAESHIDPQLLDELSAEIVSAWQDANRQLVMPATPMPPMTEETVAQGQAWFLKQACNKCHGKDGRGGSLGNVEVGRDAWGDAAAAADLTSGMFHGGGRPLDLYRRISSGINGTPMPGFGEIYREHPDTIWHLVHFVQHLGERRRLKLPPLGAAEIAAVESRLDELTQIGPPTDADEATPGEEAETPAAEEEETPAAEGESADEPTAAPEPAVDRGGADAAPSPSDATSSSTDADPSA